MEKPRMQEVIKLRLDDLKKKKEKCSSPTRYEASKKMLDYHLKVFKETGDILLQASENKQFVIDEENVLFICYLIAYLDRWEGYFSEFSEQLTGVEGDLYASLLIMGEKGVRKTLLMQVASEFCNVMQLYCNGFINTSSSELLNYFRVHGDIDYFTYNIGRVAIREGNPYTVKPTGVCLHDLGIEREKENKQKVFGTDMQAVTNDFLMARYELYQNYGLKFHITTNLDIDSVIMRYPHRVADRFKQMNQVNITGKSRRR